MGRRPDPAVAEIKACLRDHLDEALSLRVGLVLHCATARDYVLGLVKQVKREQPRWLELIARPGKEPDEIYIIRKEPDLVE